MYKYKSNNGNDYINLMFRNFKTRIKEDLKEH